MDIDSFGPALTRLKGDVDRLHRMMAKIAERLMINPEDGELSEQDRIAIANGEKPAAVTENETIKRKEFDALADQVRQVTEKVDLASGFGTQLATFRDESAQDFAFMRDQRARLDGGHQPGPDGIARPGLNLPPDGVSRAGSDTQTDTVKGGNDSISQGVGTDTEGGGSFRQTRQNNGDLINGGDNGVNQSGAREAMSAQSQAPGADSIEGNGAHTVAGGGNGRPMVDGGSMQERADLAAAGIGTDSVPGAAKPLGENG